MFRRLRTVTLVLSLTALVGALGPAAGATAQEPAAEPAPELFLESVDVDVVELEVTVTDEDGNPVRGLTREDFRVFEDGEPVELTNFYAVEGGRRVLAEDEALPGGDPALGELPLDQRLNLAVVVDNANILPANRKRVLDDLVLHVGKVVRPGDRVMVLGIDRSIHVEQSLTDDMAAVLSAIDRLGRSTGARVDLLGQERMIRLALNTRDGFQPGQSGTAVADTPGDAAHRAMQMIESYAIQADARSRETFEAIGRLIDSMAGLEGRNAVLYVSDGVSARPAEALLEELMLAFPDVQNPGGVIAPTFDANRWDSSDAMRRVARKAAADQVVFYSLDAKGLASGASVEQATISQSVTTGADLADKDAMMYLAAATGGEVMLNPAGVSRLVDRMASDYTDYYSLGYTSPSSQDGDYHRVEVRIPGRRGLRVRHTEGYQGKSSDQRMIERTLSALVFDVADNPLAVRIELGEEQTGTRKQVVLPVLIRVPISKLLLIPRESSHHGRLKIYLAVRDAEGRVAQPEPIEVSVDIPNDQLVEALSRELGHGLNLQIRSGESKLAVGVRDEVAAVESTVNLSVSLDEG